MLDWSESFISFLSMINSIFGWGVFITVIWWLGYLHKKQNLKVPGIFDRVFGFVFAESFGMLVLILIMYPFLYFSHHFLKVDLLNQFLSRGGLFDSAFIIAFIFSWIFLNLIAWHIHTRKWQLKVRDIYIPVLVMLFVTLFCMSVSNSLNQKGRFQFYRFIPEKLMLNIHSALEKYHQKYHRYPNTLDELTQDVQVEQPSLLSPTTINSDTLEKYHHPETFYSGVNYLPLPDDAPDFMIQAWFYSPNEWKKGLVLFKSGEIAWLDENELLLALADTSYRLDLKVTTQPSLPTTQSAPASRAMQQ